MQIYRTIAEWSSSDKSEYYRHFWLAGFSTQSAEGRPCPDQQVLAASESDRQRPSAGLHAARTLSVSPVTQRASISRAGTTIPQVADRSGTFSNSEPNPSAIVGCARIASRSLGYGSSASIAVCTTAITSPASAPIIVKPRMRSSFAADENLHKALRFRRSSRSAERHSSATSRPAHRRLGAPLRPRSVQRERVEAR